MCGSVTGDVAIWLALFAGEGFGGHISAITRCCIRLHSNVALASEANGVVLMVKRFFITYWYLFNVLVLKLIDDCCYTIYWGFFHVIFGHVVCEPCLIKNVYE